MSYTLSSPHDLGFLSLYVVGTGNTIRTGSGDSDFFTPSDYIHYYDFSYAGGLSTVSIQLNIEAAQALQSNPNYHEYFYGEIMPVVGLTALSSPTGITSVAGNIVGDGAQGNYTAGTTETITFQVASANPGRAVFEIDGFGYNGTTVIPGTDTPTPDVAINMNYQVFVDIKSESPVYATNTNTAATKNGQVTLGNLLTSASGASYRQLELWDSAGGSGGGFVVNGVQQNAGQEIDITQAQFANTSFHVGTAGGTDNLWVRVQQNDGSPTSWLPFTVTSPVDRAPIVSATANVAAAHKQSFAASSLFSVVDPDGDAITAYQLWDSTQDPASGHWVVNGVAQPSGQTIDLTPAQLASTTFQTGSGSDQLWIRASDGAKWSDWKGLSINAPLDHFPVVNALTFTASHNQNIAATNLFSVSDSDGDAIITYELWDSTADPTSGHWVVGGVAQPAQQAIDVSPAQLASVTFQSGSGSDHLWVRATDGIGWGAWQDFNVNAPIDHAPVITSPNFTASHNQNILATTLFSVSDADHDTISAYQLWDSTADPTSGHWVVGGLAQPSGQAINVSAAQLSSTAFQSGSGSDHLWVRAFDGTMWSDWASFNVNAPVNHAPVVTAGDHSASHGQSFSASSLFSVSDADHDTITAYQLWDSTADPSSGYWSVGGAAQSAGQAINVTAAQLSSTTFQSGSGSDHLWVRASDGIAWSDWAAFNVNAPVDLGPTETVANRTAAPGQTFAASSLFTYSDPFASAATQYDLWDTGAGGGHFALSGVALPSGHDNIITAAQLSQTTYVAGIGADTLWVKANDGTTWGAWSKGFTVTG